MKAIFRTLWFTLVLTVTFSLRAQDGSQAQFFLFDRADATLQATPVENPLAYDAGIASSPEGLWIAWLELQPGKGDQLWFGLRGKAGWSNKRQLFSKPGDYANPTPIIDAHGELWLTYESAHGGKWDIVVQKQEGNGKFSEPKLVSTGPGANINHRVALDPKGGFWVVWQSERSGQFDILARHVSPTTAPLVISDSTQNDWEPSAAVTPDGALHVVWDSYDGQSYNILERSVQIGNFSPIRIIAGSPAFEAHAQIASDKQGKLWVSWEEDGQNWGKAYRARTPGQKKSAEMGDDHGPLHRFRKLHLAELDQKKLELREWPIPMPSFQVARARTNAPAGLKNFGACYERGQLVIDGQARPWLVYRHYYAPRFGVFAETHKQQNAPLYARCLLPEGWSELFSFSGGQGDGLQRICVVPQKNGIQAAWTGGRSDRRKSNADDGAQQAGVELPKATLKVPVRPQTVSIYQGEAKALHPAPRARASAEVAGKHYDLFFGDLHRHTDISLCFSPGDGTIDDAYRYAIDAAPLDFLGITDHTHDLAMGDQLSLIWWRSRKEVNRHQLAGRFIPFFAYERSRGDTDHNVISLREDVLRPHTYPLPRFWQELDTNTFTIPHQPFKRGVWENKDNIHRPLLEIFQGFRNEAKEADAQEGLKGGHEFGFIASSDHLATSSSFACVWAEKPERESLFRAMQARRTFGATARIALKVTCAGHWMGEKFSAKTMPAIEVELTPTASVEKIELVRDGQLERSLIDVLSVPGSPLRTSFKGSNTGSGEHIFYVRLRQSDGNMAWSSPLWVKLEP